MGMITDRARWLSTWDSQAMQQIAKCNVPFHLNGVSYLPLALFFSPSLSLSIVSYRRICSPTSHYSYYEQSKKKKEMGWGVIICYFCPFVGVSACLNFLLLSSHFPLLSQIHIVHDVLRGCQGCHRIPSDWLQIGTNLRLLKIRFSTFWLAEPKCTETDL